MKSIRTVPNVEVITFQIEVYAFSTTREVDVGLSNIFIDFLKGDDMEDTISMTFFQLEFAKEYHHR